MRPSGALGEYSLMAYGLSGRLCCVHRYRCEIVRNHKGLLTAHVLYSHIWTLYPLERCLRKLIVIHPKVGGLK